MGVVTGPLDARVWHQKTELNLAPDFAKMAAAMATPIMPSVLAPVPLAFSDSVLGTAATSGSHPTPSDLAKSSFPPMLAFSTGPCPVAYPVTHPSVGPVPMSFTVPSASPKARYGSSTSRAQLSLSPLATRPATAMASFGQKEAVPSTRIDASREPPSAEKERASSAHTASTAFSGLPLRARLAGNVRSGPLSRQAAHRQSQLVARARFSKIPRATVGFQASIGLAPEAMLPGQVLRHPSQKLQMHRVLIWHCRHPHGLFSMFSLALGHADSCEKQGLGLVVDWSSSDLLYSGPPGEPNLWNAFFCQPAELKITPEALSQAIRFGQFVETSKHNVVWGAYRGVIQDYGDIPLHQAARGRALCRRNIVLRPRFQEKLESAMEHLPEGRRLAVHIRRSDKASEAAANFELTDEGLLERILAQCVVWQMDGVFLCTDDAALKQRLTESLKQCGLLVSTYDATLPADASKAVHFDKSLDSYKKAEDVVMEVLLMARGCRGLLSTYSNVSAAVVYLSPDSFTYTTFWDPVDANMQACREETVLTLSPEF
ncbi:unnamed protein product [Effrenium voratum]|uniref:Uncharacterized protein n=1 Tax=Effrenium voratum TaxID=2562239 RepID=A0AA36JCE6_9DINO|nr:unnamed protein product [Effrenium voratum]CAJ1430541.1 unnamed protein product [Effrenium voratum]